jgi:UDPglucose--hexose-1-phosphate uridylyltransferase
VIVAAHRQARPWNGQTVGAEDERVPPYSPECYLCPRNERSSGTVNPDYRGVHVFDNDHPCVGTDAPAETEPPPPFRVRRADGIARVISYTPRHDLTIARMSLQEIACIVDTWQRETRDLGRRRDVKQVLIFENKGEVVGVSNPHPHGQIYATNFTWKTFDVELDAQRRYAREQKGRALFADIIDAERRDGRRVLYEDEHVIVFVPHFARYAYEVYVAPTRRVPHISSLSDAESQSLARALKEITVRYDNLWRQPFPYVMPLHQAPTDGGDYRDFHFFIGFLPPLRRPGTLKYLAGPEIGGGNFLSDTSPEEKAAELRAQSTVHYRELASI